jgi:chromosome segregation ATPase
MCVGVAGNLPGTVFGRICDCVHAPDTRLVAVLNTALSCAANLGSTLVVSNRATALAVLEHMRTTRAGCVRCLIADEVAAPAEGGAARRMSPALLDAGAQSLARCVDARPGCESALHVVQNLLASWVAVSDWSVAERCSAAQKGSRDRFGIVTQCAPFLVSHAFAIAWFMLKSDRAHLR